MELDENYYGRPETGLHQYVPSPNISTQAPETLNAIKKPKPIENTSIKPVNIIGNYF